MHNLDRRATVQIGGLTIIKWKGLAPIANNSKSHDELLHLGRKWNLLFYHKDLLVNGSFRGSNS